MTEPEEAITISYTELISETIAEIMNDIETAFNEAGRCNLDNPEDRARVRKLISLRLYKRYSEK